MRQKLQQGSLQKNQSHSGINLILSWLVICFMLGTGNKAYALGKKSQPTVNNPIKNMPLPPGEFDLRVLSYNIKALPWPATKGGPRIAEMGRILAKQRAAGNAPHVVVLQEAIHPDTEDLIKNAGYPVVIRGPKGKGLRFPSGLILLSEFNVVSKHESIFSRCTSWDCFTRKGVLHVRLEVPELPQYVDLFTTHMNSDPNSDPFVSEEKARAARQQQMLEMNHFVLEHWNFSNPAILAGDFNFRVNSEHYEIWTIDYGYINSGASCVQQQNCSGDLLTDINEDWQTTVDHQWYWPSLSQQINVMPTHYLRNFKEKYQNNYLSDHWGLENHYRLTW